MYGLKSPIRSLTLTEAKLSNLKGPNPGRNQGQIAHFLASEPHHKLQEMGDEQYVNLPSWLMKRWGITQVFIYLEF